MLHEWTERGVRPFPRRDENAHLRRVPAGTPYHIARLFGFWVVNDVDALLLSAKRGETELLMLVIGGVSDRFREANCLFVCPKCAARFGEANDGGMRRELRGLHRLRAEARACLQCRCFAATCPKCGHVHPPTYGFHAEADTAEERAARNAD